MQQKIANDRALQLLNKCKPQHPPDIYYIRRNKEMLDRFLDQSQMDKLI